jgi:hypothetical protein
VAVQPIIKISHSVIKSPVYTNNNNSVVPRHLILRGAGEALINEINLHELPISPREKRCGEGGGLLSLRGYSRSQNSSSYKLARGTPAGDDRRLSRFSSVPKLENRDYVRNRVRIASMHSTCAYPADTAYTELQRASLDDRDDV